VSGAPREPWKWASKTQFRTVNTVSETVIVMITTSMARLLRDRRWVLEMAPRGAGKVTPDPRSQS
jgi:hypothetical protein